ncbi:MAG: hypothetical protein D6797_05055 [Bdellovibrio sp.]|nr:MAG: hypothetical protein D6797_05055 [Bdellovibrio sp.]
MKQPYKIPLQEIPPEGREYTFTEKSGELNQELKDLLGTHSYHIEIFIKPQGNIFEIKGSIKAKREFICSFCAKDLEKEVNESFHELLFIEKKPLPRKSHSSQHFSPQGEQELFCNYLGSSDFFVGSYFHEIIALAEPYQIYKEEACLKRQCPFYKEALKKGYISSVITDENKVPENTHRPFSVLKKLKIKT